MKSLPCLLLALSFCNVISGLNVPQESASSRLKLSREFAKFSRDRRLLRMPHRIIDPIEDCFLVTSDQEKLYFRSTSNEPTTCGIYMIADPDKNIQVTFNHFDVPCEDGGLVAWVDGWELNGQIWPADAWSDDRLEELCNIRTEVSFVSQQNAALIQYRVPSKGKGFAVTIRHVRNLKPCNVMIFGTTGVYTLRNHGMPGNCSITAVAPAAVKILDIDVGRSDKRTFGLVLETGTIHYCRKRGLSDFVDIGGANGLDNTKMDVIDSVCGLDSNKGLRPFIIACEVTVVQLVSSGRFRNSVTLDFSNVEPEDFQFANLICELNMEDKAIDQM